MRRNPAKLFLAAILMVFFAAEASKAGPRVVTDQAGDRVPLPDRIDRVVITSPFPLPSVYALLYRSVGNLVGMHPASLSAARYSMLPKVAPEVVNVDSSFIKNGELNVEELLKLRPDVVLYNASNMREKAVLQKARIPAVAFSASARGFDVMETLNGWLELMGEVFQREVTVKPLVDYGRRTYDEIQQKLAGLSEKDKPRAMFLFNYGEGRFRTGGSNLFSQYWCDATGAVNVAAEIKGWADINMEQVYEWNPDIIYITNFTAFMPEDLYQNKGLPNHDWSGVKAVRDRKVYKLPLGIYRSFTPSGDSPLCLKFLAKHNHPELFESMDLEKEFREYYRRFYGIELSDQDIKNIFNPAREAAGQVS